MQISGKLQVATPISIATKPDKRLSVIEETLSDKISTDKKKRSDSDNPSIEMNSKVKKEHDTKYRPALTREARTRSEFKSVVFKPYRDWNWHEDDLEVDWTVDDDACLQSIDRLHSRTIEFHNNIHTRHIYRAPGSLDDNETGIFDMQRSMARSYTTRKSMGNDGSMSHSTVLSYAAGLRDTISEDDPVATVVRFRNMEGPYAWSKFPKKVTAREFREWVKPFNGSTGEGNMYYPRRHTTTTRLSAASSGLSRARTVSQIMNDVACHGAVTEVRSLASEIAAETITSTIDGFWGDGSAAGAEQTLASRETAKKAAAEALKAASGLQSFEKDLAMCDLLWIHIDDLQGLQEISRIYEMHELFLSGFADEREHNTLLVDALTVFLSVCTCFLDGSAAHMQKVYMFVSFGDGLIITMEKEVMAENRDHAPHRKAGGFANSASRIVGELLDTKLGDAESDFYELGCSLGGAYIINQIALHSLAIQDTILDFFSHSTNYFNHVKNLEMKLHNIDKLFITKQLHCTKRVVAMVKDMTALSVDTYSKLFQYVSAGGFNNISTFSIKDREIMRFGKVSGNVEAKSNGKVGLGGMRPGIPKVKRPTREWLNKVKATNGKADNGFMEEVSMYKLFYPSIEESVNFFDFYGRKSESLLAEEKEANEVRPSLAILTEAQTGLLYFIVEKFKFATSTIQASQDDVDAVSVQVQQDTDLRAVNTDTLMAVISTLFLPASFLSGMCSTNFQPKAGESTYDNGKNNWLFTTLQAPWGNPVLLWGILGLTMLTGFYFTRGGVIDWSVNWKRVCSYLTGYHYICRSRTARDPTRAKYQEAVIQRATGDYVRVRVLTRTTSTSTTASVDKNQDDRQLLRKLTNITIAEDEEMNRASLYDMGGLDKSIGSQESLGSSHGLGSHGLGSGQRPKSMKDLFISHMEEHSSDDDAASGYLPRSRQESRQNSTNSVGSASGSNNIIWESQAAKILKRSGLRPSIDGGDSAGSRSSFSDMLVDHHLVHRFREQNHQHRKEQAKTAPEIQYTAEQLEDIRTEELFARGVKLRRSKIMELAALPATVSVEGEVATGRGSSFTGSNRFGGNVSSLGRSGDVVNPLSQSMHQLGSLTSHRRSITNGRRSQIDMYNTTSGFQGEPASAQSHGNPRGSYTGSLLSMLHLDFLLGTKAADTTQRTGSLSMRNSISGINRRRSHDVSHDLGDSDDEEGIATNFELEEDEDNAKETARLAEVEKRRIAIAQGRFNNKKVKVIPLVQNFRTNSLSKSTDGTSNPLQRSSSGK